MADTNAPGRPAEPSGASNEQRNLPVPVARHCMVVVSPADKAVRVTEAASSGARKSLTAPDPVAWARLPASVSAIVICTAVCATPA